MIECSLVLNSRKDNYLFLGFIGYWRYFSFMEDNSLPQYGFRECVRTISFAKFVRNVEFF